MCRGVVCAVSNSCACLSAACSREGTSYLRSQKEKPSECISMHASACTVKCYTIELTSHVTSRMRAVYATLELPSAACMHASCIMQKRNAVERTRSLKLVIVADTREITPRASAIHMLPLIVNAYGFSPSPSFTPTADPNMNGKYKLSKTVRRFGSRTSRLAE